jgi:hypothetical protein
MLCTTTSMWPKLAHSTANKANLDYEEAVPALTQGLTRALAGLF